MLKMHLLSSALYHPTPNNYFSTIKTVTEAHFASNSFKHAHVDDVPKVLSETHSFEMGCPALGIWVAFFKQPDALPGRAPQKNKNKIFLNCF
jgi:hypothetical protein